MRGFGEQGAFPEYERVLDEMVENGYEGTELGDWGFMPTDPQVLLQLKRRGLELVGALVRWPLADSSRQQSALRDVRPAGRSLRARRQRLCGEPADGRRLGGRRPALLCSLDAYIAERTRSSNP